MNNSWFYELSWGSLNDGSKRLIDSHKETIEVEITPHKPMEWELKYILEKFLELQKKYALLIRHKAYYVSLERRLKK